MANAPEMPEPPALPAAPTPPGTAAPPAATIATTIAIDCLRYDPEADTQPHWQRYTLPLDPAQSLLQALLHIKDWLDGSLSLRWSCRMAICGSCGVMVDGVPRLACHTFLRDLAPGPVRVEPLQHFPILRDLVVDPSRFLDHVESVQPWLQPRQPRPLAAGVQRQTPQQMAAYLGTAQCIQCQLCYAACPQFGLDPDFTGPAALALLQRFNADSRDQGWPVRAAQANADTGVWGCTLVGECSVVCPQGVDPAQAINQNKLRSLADRAGLLRLLAPRGAQE